LWFGARLSEFNLLSFFLFVKFYAMLLLLWREEGKRSERMTDASGAARFVLVVDNDANSLVFMSMLFQRLEFPASPVNNVDKALETANISAPTLIIMEMKLRGMSGLELMSRVRQGTRSRTVPVIMMTKDLTPELEEQCRQAGVAGCLNKPIQADELYQMIQPIIEPGSRRRNIRIQTHLSVTLDNTQLDSGQGECASMLSANGMYIRTLRALQLNAPVLIRIDLHGQTFSAEAKVIYIDTLVEGPSGMTGVALQFQKLMPRGKELIRKFINDEVTHGLAPEWT
jgi:CheY-like chemotaxis protein